MKLSSWVTGAGFKNINNSKWRTLHANLSWFGPSTLEQEEFPEERSKVEIMLEEKNVKPEFMALLHMTPEESIDFGIEVLNRGLPALEWIVNTHKTISINTLLFINVKLTALESQIAKTKKTINNSISLRTV